MKKIKKNKIENLLIPIVWFRNHFFLYLERVQKNSSLVLIQLLAVLQYLKRNSAPLSQTSIENIGRNTNCSRNVVINSIKIFKKIELIEQKKTKAFSGGYKNTYSVNESVYKKISSMDLNRLSTWFYKRVEIPSEFSRMKKIAEVPSEAKKFRGWEKKMKRPDKWTSKEFIGYYLRKFKEFYGYEDPDFLGIKHARFLEGVQFRVSNFILALPDKNKVLCKDYVDWIFKKVGEPGYWFKDKILTIESVFSMKKKYFLKEFLSEKKKKSSNISFEESLKRRGEI